MRTLLKNVPKCNTSFYKNFKNYKYNYKFEQNFFKNEKINFNP